MVAINVVPAANVARPLIGVVIPVGSNIIFRKCAHVFLLLDFTDVFTAVNTP